MKLRKTLAVHIIDLLAAFAAISMTAVFLINVRAFEETLENREADKVLRGRFIIDQILA